MCLSLSSLSGLSSISADPFSLISAYVGDPHTSSQVSKEWKEFSEDPLSYIDSLESLINVIGKSRFDKLVDRVTCHGEIPFSSRQILEGLSFDLRVRLRKLSLSTFPSKWPLPLEFDLYSKEIVNPSQFKKIDQWIIDESVLRLSPCFSGWIVRSRNIIKILSGFSSNQKHEMLANDIRACIDFNAEDITRINLSETGISEIPEEIFTLPNLRELNLSKNNLKFLSNQISKLSNLEWLNFDENKIPAIPTQLYALTNLRCLNISKNPIAMLAAEIGNLINLRILHCSEIGLVSIPNEIANLTNLELLNFRNNELTQIPIEIGRLVNLRFLYLSENQLEVIPNVIGNFLRLFWLYLDNNKLKELPSEIRNLINLDALDLGSNEFHSVPTSIESLIELRSLNFNHNKLTIIPEWIQRLSSLQNLDLSYNQLTVIPATIGKMNSLYVLDLRNNCLTFIPKFLFRLRLKDLIIEENPLKPIPRPMFLKCIDVCKLSCSRLTKHSLFSTRQKKIIGRITCLAMAAGLVYIRHF